MADGLEVRIAHLEGAYEQLDRRLASVETRLGAVEGEIRALRRELEDRFDGLRRELQDRMDSHLHWILGIQIASWLSIIGAMFALFYKR